RLSALLLARSRTPRPPPLSHPLSLHDAFPISCISPPWVYPRPMVPRPGGVRQPEADRSAAAASHGLRRQPRTTPRSTLEPPCPRSEEHTSELQSRENLVCRLLLEKKNDAKQTA